MRVILVNEICNEKTNSAALGAFNSVKPNSPNIETPQQYGFKKVEASELVKSLNEKATGYKFKEWQKGDIHRIYVNGGSLYKTGKVDQNAYIDVKTGKVSVFTNSNQPTKWNVSQSQIAKDNLEKYGRFVRMFGKK